MSADGPLFNKFIVDRVDGAMEDPDSKHFGNNCWLFVLDISHDRYAPVAIAAYADACEATHPILAQALRDEATRRGIALPPQHTMTKDCWCNPTVEDFSE